jgi:hypothetical protein
MAADPPATVQAQGRALYRYLIFSPSQLHPGFTGGQGFADRSAQRGPARFFGVFNRSHD